MSTVTSPGPGSGTTIVRSSTGAPLAMATTPCTCRLMPPPCPARTTPGHPGLSPGGPAAARISGVTHRTGPWPHGAPCWPTLGTGDEQRARAFYGEVLGWEFVDAGVRLHDWTLATAGGGTVAGVGAVRSTGSSEWVLAFAVDDLGAAAAAIVNAGGQLQQPGHDVLARGGPLRGRPRPRWAALRPAGGGHLRRGRRRQRAGRTGLGGRRQRRPRGRPGRSTARCSAGSTSRSRAPARRTPCSVPAAAGRRGAVSGGNPTGVTAVLVPVVRRRVGRGRRRHRRPPRRRRPRRAGGRPVGDASPGSRTRTGAVFGGRRARLGRPARPPGLRHPGRRGMSGRTPVVGPTCWSRSGPTSCARGATSASAASTPPSPASTTATTCEVLRRAFQLDPTAVSDHPGDDVPSHTARLAAKFGTDEAQVRQMHDRLADLGAADGIDFRFDDVRSANTVDAHRLLHLAHDLGLADVLEDRFFRAVFTDGEPVGDRPTLRRVAVDAGLPAADVDDVLGLGPLRRRGRRRPRPGRDLRHHRRAVLRPRRPVRRVRRPVGRGPRARPHAGLGHRRAAPDRPAARSARVSGGGS